VRTGAPRPYSHASLWIANGGRNPDKVLDRLIHYTKEKAGSADDLPAPFAMQYLGSVLLRPDARPVWVQDVDLMRRIPFGDAVALQRELKALGAEVQLIHVVELRIYLETDDTRNQLKNIVAEKSPKAQR
jgi:hypothetical protein